VLKGGKELPKSCGEEEEEEEELEELGCGDSGEGEEGMRKSEISDICF
jgi:hypothetical protein